MIDPRIVYRRFEKIKENLAMLSEAGDMPFEAFVSDPIRYYATERALQVSAQAIIDICAHIVTETQAKMPNDYKDLPLALGKVGIISKDLAERLSHLVSMRNILVHQYLDVDLSIVHRALRENLGDFDEFASCVTEYLEREGIT